MSLGICLPWTDKTCPLKSGDTLRYIEQDDQYRITIKKVTSEGIISNEVPFISFSNLRNYFITSDGKPCGKYMEERSLSQ